MKLNAKYTCPDVRKQLGTKPLCLWLSDQYTTLKFCHSGVTTGLNCDLKSFTVQDLYWFTDRNIHTWEDRTVSWGKCSWLAGSFLATHTGFSRWWRHHIFLRLTATIFWLDCSFLFTLALLQTYSPYFAAVTTTLQSMLNTTLHCCVFQQVFFTGWLHCMMYVVKNGLDWFLLSSKLLPRCAVTATSWSQRQKTWRRHQGKNPCSVGQWNSKLINCVGFAHNMFWETQRKYCWDAHFGAFSPSQNDVAASPLVGGVQGRLNCFGTLIWLEPIRI